MCPASEAERHDGPGLLDELVSSVAAVVDESVVGGEHGSTANCRQELPDVLLRIYILSLTAKGPLQKQRNRMLSAGQEAQSDSCKRTGRRFRPFKTVTAQGNNIVSFSATTLAAATATPEPASLAVLGASLAGLGLIRRKKA